MLQFNVLHHNFNTNKIEPYNIISQSLLDDIKKNKQITDYESYKQYLKRQFMYDFWCKSECEILVGGLFQRTKNDLTKIDIYTQIEMNFDIIADLIAKEIKLKF